MEVPLDEPSVFSGCRSFSDSNAVYTSREDHRHEADDPDYGTIRVVKNRPHQFVSRCTVDEADDKNYRDRVPQNPG